MKNYEIIFLTQALRKVDAPVMNGRFNYVISDAISKADIISEHIRTALKPDKKFTEYDDKLNKLRREYSTKDKEGNPIVTEFNNGMKHFDIPQANDPESDFMKAYNSLSEEYKEIISIREEQLKFLDEENTDFKPLKLTYKDLPDGLSREDMNAVYLIMHKENE